MKKSILALSLLSTLAFLTTACGGGNDNKTDPKDVVINYTTSGKYDLSRYITSTNNQINNYVEKEYTDDKGKKKYDQQPDETSYYATRFDVNGSTIKEYTDDELDTTYTILADKITDLDADDESITNIARFGDKGDYIIKIDKRLQENGITFNIINVCKISKYLESKAVNGNNYTDVLKLSCESSGTTEEGAKLNGVSYSVQTSSEIESYFAKDNGLIWEESETCTTTTVNKTTNNQCEKSITEITTINK